MARVGLSNKGDDKRTDYLENLARRGQETSNNLLAALEELEAEFGECSQLFEPCPSP